MGQGPGAQGMTSHTQPWQELPACTQLGSGPCRLRDWASLPLSHALPWWALSGAEGNSVSMASLSSLAWPQGFP